MGPDHQGILDNTASVPDTTHYATPLGEIPLDCAFLAKLRESALFKSVRMVHEREHSVQNEVPLLQHVLDDFLLVPIVIGRLDIGTARAMADILVGMRQTSCSASDSMQLPNERSEGVPRRFA